MVFSSSRSFFKKSSSSPDGDGYIEIDLGKIVDYIIKEAHKDEMGDYDPDEILFIVQGEMEYTESLEDE